MFILIVVLCSLLEYYTSYAMEKIFKMRWWDYNHFKFNINGRICLETMIPFGLIGCFMLYFVHPSFLKLISSLNPIIIQISFYVTLIIFLVDLIVSGKVISNIKIITSSIVKDNTEEVKGKVREVIKNKINKFKPNKISIEGKIQQELTEKNFFTKRFIDSFPKFHVIRRIINRKGDKNGR